MKVFTVHGIRRKNRWYEEFEQLEGVRKGNIEIYKFDFGYFRIIDFISKRKREEIINKFCTFYSNKMMNSSIRPCVIAHSFGTYVVLMAMKKYDVIKFDKIIFCGSILNSETDFRVFLENGQVKTIINDYGEKEWFVKLTKWIVDEYCGDAGRVGFKDIPPKYKDMILNRKNYKEHSDYFLPLHMQENWLPHIAKSKRLFN